MAAICCITGRKLCTSQKGTGGMFDEAAFCGRGKHWTIDEWEKVVEDGRSEAKERVVFRALLRNAFR